MLGQILCNQLQHKKINCLQDAEFRIFSQWGDDGIIQHLIRAVKEKLPQTFIEFGVENYMESNTRFLLIHNNWKGLVLDSSLENIDFIRKNSIYWKHNLIAKSAFVTVENIESLVEDSNLGKEIGLLHIDIDGNDYWVWKAIVKIKPVIVIMEYNSVFGMDRAITIPYNPTFNRTKAHFSNLYFGASLLALCGLAEQKGYYFVGCNSNGNNAYFIRKDQIADIQIVTPENGYVLSQFRESRDENYNLSYVSGLQRLKLIQGLPVWNTQSEKTELI